MASGGLRELIPAVARACVAVGIDGIFMEVCFVVPYIPADLHLAVVFPACVAGLACLPRRHET